LANFHDGSASRVCVNAEAMLQAMIYPESEKGGRGKKRTETGQFSKQRLSVARSVLHHSRPLAESVIKGSVSIDEALEHKSGGITLVA
jgi:hypothetical protein